MTARQSFKTCFIIWGWLMILLLAAVGASQLSLPSGLLISIIFGLAVVKAILVALYYMHLRSEHFLFSLIALVPLLLFAILTISLFPDFVYNR